MSVSLNNDEKNSLAQLLECEKAINKLEKALKVYKSRRSELQDAVKQTVESKNIKSVKLHADGTKIQAVTKVSKLPANKKWIQDRLRTYCMTKNLNVNDLIDFVYNPKYRGDKTTSTIKTILPKEEKK